MAHGNPFKAWMTGEGPKTPLGTFLMSGAASTAEALGFAGFDFLLLDMEHTPIGVPQATDILRAIAGTPAHPIVRLAWNDQVLIKQMLDAGAPTLMVPFVQTVEEARQAVAFTRYPPDGVRGFAAMHRASRFGTMAGFAASASERVGVILQLETPEAVGRLAEIAAVPGVDALFVGPGDLSAAMGHIGNIAHAEVQAVLEAAAQSAKAIGMPIGTVGPNPEMVKRFVGYGYDYVAVGSDMAFMMTRATEFIAAMRNTALAAAPTTAY